MPNFVSNVRVLLLSSDFCHCGLNSFGLLAGQQNSTEDTTFRLTDYILLIVSFPSVHLEECDRRLATSVQGDVGGMLGVSGVRNSFFPFAFCGEARGNLKSSTTHTD